MDNSVSAHCRKGTGSMEGNREQGTGNRDLGGLPAKAHQAARFGASSCGYVDNCLTEIIDGWTAAAESSERGLTSNIRHSVTRIGERQLIPEPVRLAVIRRDGSRCGICGWWLRYADIEIDHVIPWSAGGSDRTDNLRVLCRPCNQARSNFVDTWGEQRRRLPATWWCTDCADPLTLPHLPGKILFVSPTIEVDDPIRDQHPSCTWCQKAWWQLAPIAEAPEPVLAFCAHCDATAYTQWAL